MRFLDKDTIAGDKVYTVEDATLYHFAVLTSAMHMAWMKTLAGRLKSDYSYTNQIVYNNFVWPDANSEQKAEITKLAQNVLTARKEFPGSTLADLYDPLTMPPVLRKAHQKLDKAVDKLYGLKSDCTDQDRVTLLFELYQKATG